MVWIWWTCIKVVASYWVKTSILLSFGLVTLKNRSRSLIINLNLGLHVMHDWFKFGGPAMVPWEVIAQTVFCILLALWPWKVGQAEFKLRCGIAGIPHSFDISRMEFTTRAGMSRRVFPGTVITAPVIMILDCMAMAIPDTGRPTATASQPNHAN